MGWLSLARIGFMVVTLGWEWAYILLLNFLAHRVCLLLGCIETSFELIEYVILGNGVLKVGVGVSVSVGVGVGDQRW